MDAVTEYLHNKGIEVQPAYFGNSFYEYGKVWDSEHWSMIYRLDEGSLTVCNFTSKDNTNGMSSAVLQMVEKLKQIKKDVAEVKQITGKVLIDEGFQVQKDQHRAFHSILLKQGAREELGNDGTLWLIY
ncbi:MAG: secretion protein [Parashewanella sp.]